MKTAIPSANQPKEYYCFENYISRQRILTYWYQIREALNLQPSNMLEIGIGSGLVASFIRTTGVDVKTVDINRDLNPDYCGSIMQLTKVTGNAKFDLILCARVLHHIPYHDLETALDQLAQTTTRHLILTLPYEDFALNFGFRYTSARERYLRLPLPLGLKKLFFWNRTRSGIWKIADSREHSLKKMCQIIEKHFQIIHQYRIPEDSAHQVFVCRLR